MHLAVLSCTVIGRVDLVEPWLPSLDEYQIHKSNAAAITELPGEA